VATVIERADLSEDEDLRLAERLTEGAQRIQAELGKLIIGQGHVVEHMLLSLFVGGNSLLIGVPGLAKTLLVHTLAQVLNLKFSRIQFTPDLMPSDITGTDIIQEDAQTGRRQMVFAPGPIFANIVLADEINRTPPKTQAALLEAMQEHRVTMAGADVRAGGAVLRVRDAEPDRAGGHVSAAGGAARPVHVPDRHRASAGEDELRSCARRRRCRTMRSSMSSREPTSSRSSSWCGECRSPIRCCGMRSTWCVRAPGRRRARGCRAVPGLHQRVGVATAPACARRSTSTLGGKARALMAGRIT
jgi:hypothetical protein